MSAARTGRLVSGAVLLLVASTTVASAQVSEADTIRARATAILQAYRARDVDALLALIQPSQRARARSSLVPGDRFYESILGESSWRWRAVRGWRGELGEVRLDGTRARVRFADLPSGEIAVVTLRKVDHVWYFDDVHSPSSSAFAAWGQRVE